MSRKSARNLVVVLVIFAAATLSVSAAANGVDKGTAFVESMRSALRDPVELQPLEVGTAVVKVNSVPGGTQYDVRVDAPNVVGVRIEQPGTGRVLVAISAVERRGQRARKNATANVIVTAESLDGVRAVRIKGAAPDNLSLIFETSSGHEVEWVLTSTGGLDGKIVEIPFDPSHELSRAYVIDCSGASWYSGVT